MALNANNVLDTTELATGKDGKLFVTINGTVYFLAEVDTFSTNMEVQSVDVQPVGSIVVGAVPTGVIFTLNYSEMVVRDDVTLEPLLKSIKDGYIPIYTFQGVISKPDGSSEEKVTYDKAVPIGSFGLQNLTPGEVVKREANFRINKVPEVITSMASTYLSV